MKGDRSDDPSKFRIIYCNEPNESKQGRIIGVRSRLAFEIAGNVDWAKDYKYEYLVAHLLGGLRNLHNGSQSHHVHAPCCRPHALSGGDADGEHVEPQPWWWTIREDASFFDYFQIYSHEKLKLVFQFLFY